MHFHCFPLNIRIAWAVATVPSLLSVIHDKTPDTLRPHWWWKCPGLETHRYPRCYQYLSGKEKVRPTRPLHQSVKQLSLSRKHVLKTRSEQHQNTLLEFTSTEEPMELQGASKRKPSTKALISRTGSSSTWSASGQGHKTNLWWRHQTYYVRWCSSSQDFISSLILAESSTQQQHRAVLLIDATSNSTNATKRLEVHLEKGKQTCKPLRQQWPYDLTAVPALAYQALPVAYNYGTGHNDARNAQKTILHGISIPVK